MPDRLDHDGPDVKAGLDAESEAWVRQHEPLRSDELRALLGPDRLKLVEAIERWLPFVRRRPKERWIHALEEFRRGLSIISAGVKYLGDAAWTDLPMPVPVITRRGRMHYVRFFDPKQVYAAKLWLEFWLGSPRAKHRPKDEERLKIGVTLASIFADQHDEPVSFGRDSLFAQTLIIVLHTLGLRAPEDPYHMLRNIRTERAARLARPGSNENQWKAYRAEKNRESQTRPRRTRPASGLTRRSKPTPGRPARRR